MYIKIKHIKQFLLFLACIFFAGFNYLTYVSAENGVNFVAIDSDKDGLTDEEEKSYKTDPKNIDTDGDGYSDGVEIESGYDPIKPAPGDKIINGSSSKELQAVVEKKSLTDEFSQELKSYAKSKEGQKITVADLRAFVDEKVSSKMDAQLTWETLPEINAEQIRVLKQPYDSLGDAEKKLKMQQDSATYLTKVSYLIVSNFPVNVTSEAEVRAYASEFQNRFATLATSNPDVEYFSDLGDRLELFSKQITEVDVPETMVSLHTKLLRLIGGTLTLREEKYSVQDPIAQTIRLNKVRDLIALFVDFLDNDFQGYIIELGNSQK